MAYTEKSIYSLNVNQALLVINMAEHEACMTTCSKGPQRKI